MVPAKRSAQSWHEKAARTFARTAGKDAHVGNTFGREGTAVTHVNQQRGMVVEFSAHEAARDKPRAVEPYARVAFMHSDRSGPSRGGMSITVDRKERFRFSNVEPDKHYTRQQTQAMLENVLRAHRILVRHAPKA